MSGFWRTVDKHFHCDATEIWHCRTKHSDKWILSGTPKISHIHPSKSPLHYCEVDEGSCRPKTLFHLVLSAPRPVRSPQDHQINWIGVLDTSDSFLFTPLSPYPLLAAIPRSPHLLQTVGVIGSMGYLTPTYQKAWHTKQGGSVHLNRKWKGGGGIE